MRRVVQRWTRRFRYWFSHSARQQLLREEMDFHLETMTADLMEEGLSEQDARAVARRKFGNMTQQSEESRATWISRWWSDALQDLHYTFRGLRQNAGFTTFAVLVVGLGIGSSSTVFSVMNALLLRPLPFHEPSRLAWIANSGLAGLSGATVQVGYLRDLQRQSQSFSELAAYFAFYGVGDSKLSGDGEPERLSNVPVTGNFFSMLGVQPQLGRLFTAEECKWNGPLAVMLSDSLWRRRFAADPSIVGRKLTINDRPVTVAGVLPASFDFASVFSPGSRFDLFSPFPLSEETNRWGNTMAIVGRLKPGVKLESARAETEVIAAQMRREHPERNDFIPKLSMLDQQVSGRLRPALFVLACSVGIVMLIVCANLSNLQLARTAARQKEMSIRAALGAGRHRLIRQMLTESVVLSCCGAIVGVVLAVGGTRVLSRLDGINIPLLDTVRVDAGVFGFTLLMAVFTGIIFGLVPALHVPAIALHDALKDSNRGSSQGRGHAWVRSGLVVSEIAFACVLLVGAGLLIRSFLRLLDVNLGFQPERAAAIRIDPSRQYTTREQRNAYFDNALRAVRSIPGIEAAGVSDVLPLGRNRTWGAGAKGEIYSRGNYPTAFVRVVSDGYLKALGVPLKAGRDLTEKDDSQNKKVIMINESLARTLWHGQDPLGKIMLVAGEREVVGVVGNVRHLALEQESGSEMYIPIRQSNDYPSVDLIVRSALPTAGLASAVRKALRPFEPELAKNDFRDLQQSVDKAVSPRRVVVWLLAGFAGFALILASLGIYAVISYSVQQRTQEIGIRMALGDSGGHLQLGILLQTLGMASVGIVLGLVASWILARTISSLLFGVSAADPVTFIGMLVTLFAVAALAGYLPARRASRIDPIVALRAN